MRQVCFGCSLCTHFINGTQAKLIQQFHCILGILYNQAESVLWVKTVVGEFNLNTKIYPIFSTRDFFYIGKMEHRSFKR